MKKRKQKPSKQSLQKISVAQHRNEYFRRLEKLFFTLKVPHIFKLIPKNELEIIYDSRFQTIRIEAAPGSDISKEMLRNAKIVISQALKNRIISIHPDNSIIISLSDYFTIYVTLIAYIMELKEESDVFPNAKLIIEDLNVYYDFDQKDDNGKVAINQINDILMVFACFESDISRKMYWTSAQFLSEYKNKPGFFTILHIHSNSPEKKNFIIDKASRPAFRIGWGAIKPEAHFDYASITSEQLNLKTPLINSPLSVYIQSHAIQRLNERLDGVIPGDIHFNLYDSLTNNLKVSWDKNGILRFEMFLADCKVGYLIADIVESVIIIRTFLFLTNSGTPEGDKLLELTGLAIEDTKYLEINKLSTFLDSDIEKNEKVKDIFIKAGCESLFQLDRSQLAKQFESNNKPIAEFMIDYLGLNKKDEGYDDYEDSAEDGESLSY